MRAVFDTTCDLINGPGQPGAGTVRATVACRVVLEAIQVPIPYPLNARVAYITEDGAAPVEPGTIFVLPATTTLDWQYADRIAVPSGVAANYTLLFSELVTPGVGAPYWRLHVMAGAAGP